MNVEEYVVLHDLLLPHKNGTTQIDHLVLSPYGVYVIETKNYKGWIFGKEKQRNWTQVNYNKKNTFLNPIFQNYAHISSLKEILADQYNGPYFSVIAFSTKATLKDIELESDYVKVVYIPQLVKTILANKSTVISTGLSKRLAKKIEEFNIVGKEHRKFHVQAIRNKSKNIQTSIDNRICPRCNGQLVTRNGKYGKFLGCTNFPKCRYVMK